MQPRHGVGAGRDRLLEQLRAVHGELGVLPLVRAGRALGLPSVQALCGDVALDDEALQLGVGRSNVRVLKLKCVLQLRFGMKGQHASVPMCCATMLHAMIRYASCAQALRCLELIGIHTPAAQHHGVVSKQATPIRCRTAALHCQMLQLGIWRYRLRRLNLLFSCST